MKKHSRAKTRLALLAAVFAGGAAFGTGCDMRLRDAVVQGTQSFVLQLLDPSNFFTVEVPDTNDNSNDNIPTDNDNAD